MIVAAIEAEGIPCWMAPRDIPPGANYGESIIEGIKAAQILLLLLSEAANASEHVANEVERAVNYRKPILPVMLDRVSPATRIELHIASRQWIDMSVQSSADSNMKRLTDTLRDRLRAWLVPELVSPIAGLSIPAARSVDEVPPKLSTTVKPATAKPAAPVSTLGQGWRYWSGAYETRLYADPDVPSQYRLDFGAPFRVVDSKADGWRRVELSDASATFWIKATDDELQKDSQITPSVPLFTCSLAGERPGLLRFGHMNEYEGKISVSTDRESYERFSLLTDNHGEIKLPIDQLTLLQARANTITATTKRSRRFVGTLKRDGVMWIDWDGYVGLTGRNLKELADSRRLLRFPNDGEATFTRIE